MYLKEETQKNLRETMRDDFFDKIAGGWYGKLIGNQLGRSVEGKNFKEIEQEYGLIEYYVEVPNGFGPDDDPEYLVLDLHAIRVHGVALDSKILALEWLEHLTLVFTAEKVALENMKRGLMPPLSAIFRNPYQEWIGAQMRGELWGMISPLIPNLAVKLAIIDATISHSGNGVYGEIFISALVSILFTEDNVERAIKKALEYVPPDSLYFKAIKSALYRAKSKSWRECIPEIYAKYREYSPVHVLPNAEIIVTALMSESFEEGILIATNAGMDSDCNAGNVGGLLGVLEGYSSISTKWLEPLKDTYKTKLRNLPTRYVDEVGLIKISHLVDMTYEVSKRTCLEWR